jgi:hypothetical protein
VTEICKSIEKIRIDSDTKDCMLHNFSTPSRDCQPWRNFINILVFNISVFINKFDSDTQVISNKGTITLMSKRCKWG